MAKILEIRNITKSFGPVTVFKNVDLDLDTGEIIALVGENGAGKSTLMNVLGGVYPAGTFSGSIAIDGKQKRFKSERDSKNAGIEMIHQEISLHLDLSVAENIFLGNLRSNFGLVDWKGVYKEAQQHLDMVKLNVDPREKTRNLSTGQHQMLSIARALACNPKILLFDEPTSALAETDAENLLDIIRTLKERRISCIYISHRLEEVMKISDRIVVLRDGNLISNRPRVDCTIEMIIEDMVGRKLDEMYPKQQVSIGGEVMRVEALSVAHPYIVGKNIVEDISFSVKSGEILGVSGLVGSGRSETMNAIFGSLKKETGKIFIEGKEIKADRPRQAMEHGIGLLTEDRKRSGVVSSMSVRENMTLVSLKAISKSGIIEKRKEIALAQKYYNKLQVKSEGIEDSIMSLSGGNQQKVVLSKWLMKDIKVLILDEPTRGVDVGAKVEIYNIITELAKSGLAIIMVSSELPELLGMCDRLIVFSRGKIRANFTRNEATQEKVMAAATYFKKTYKSVFLEE